MASRPEEWISAHAAKTPDKPALVMAESGQTLTYADLERQSDLLARAMHSWGLRRGDHVAIMLRNRPELFVACWAAQRSGLYFTVVNGHLRLDEASYIVENCEAQVLITDVEHLAIADGVTNVATGLRHRVLVGAQPTEPDSFESALDAGAAVEPIAPVEGSAMFYSSGTTGRPKGVKRPLVDGGPGSDFGIRGLMKRFLMFSNETVYLSPAPPYHAAPLNFSMGVQRLGGTVVAMERFDGQAFLEVVARYRVTHTQVVPTMFIRMLALDDSARKKFDVTSLEVVVHSAAPCPVDVKQNMFAWFGPIIYEYYGGTERNGSTFVGPQDWLDHPGTVGKPIIGEVHVLDDDGNELGARDIGNVYFAGGPKFEYHQDPEKTSSVADTRGWTTIGDIGYVDEDGFLFLTDRKAHMIIRGGINVYPQEIENVLNAHPAVAESAVFGVPHAELGQDVQAVVELAAGFAAGDALASELLAYCKEHLAGYKCPRSVDFIDKLERTETGKLMKRPLVERYAAAAS